MAGGKVKTLTGVPPLSFRANGKPLISWSMLGNGQQDGTPTPDAPIMPTFCGERTENLYNTAETDWELGILDDSGNPTGATTSHYTKNFTAVEPETAYYLSGTIYIGQSGHRIYYYDANKNWISRSPLIVYYDGNFTTPANCKYVRFQMTVDLEPTSDWMLNPGSTPLLYEPYGWKIPVTSAGQTQNVYLGEVQTVRRVKKLVLTGQEGWNQNTTSFGMRFLLRLQGSVSSDTGAKRSICTHYPLTYAGGTSAVANAYTISSNGNLYISSDTLDGVVAFKSYLSDQYAAGTPVVIWYVLANEETSIVNEPLCKIGDYADELHSEDAGITIPTAKGENTLTVDTELQPSSMTITYR